MFVEMAKAKNSSYPFMWEVSPLTACQTITKAGAEGAIHIFLGEDGKQFFYFSQELGRQFSMEPEITFSGSKAIRVQSLDTPISPTSNLVDCRYANPLFEKLRIDALRYFQNNPDRARHPIVQHVLRGWQEAIGENVPPDPPNNFTAFSHPAKNSDSLPRRVTAATIAPEPSSKEIEEKLTDIEASIELTAERKSRHNAIVRRLANLCEQKRFQLSEDATSYDCLAWKTDGKVLLFEIKTIQEGDCDAQRQVRAGVGQLKYYRHLSLPAAFSKREVAEILVCEHNPDAHLITFCSAIDIMVVWEEDGAFRVSEDSVIQNFSPETI